MASGADRRTSLGQAGSFRCLFCWLDAIRCRLDACHFPRCRAARLLHVGGRIAWNPETQPQLRPVRTSLARRQTYLLYGSRAPAGSRLGEVAEISPASGAGRNGNIRPALDYRFAAKGGDDSPFVTLENLFQLSGNLRLAHRLNLPLGVHRSCAVTPGPALKETFCVVRVPPVTSTAPRRSRRRTQEVLLARS